MDTSKEQAPTGSISGDSLIGSLNHEQFQGQTGLSSLKASHELAPPVPLTSKGLADFRVIPSSEGASIQLSPLVRIMKPGKTTWFRTYPDDSKWACYYLFSPGDMHNITYLVAPGLVEAMGGVACLKWLVPYVTLEGQIYFWPLSASGTANTWNDSARKAASEAMTEWRRIVADMNLKQYKIYAPQTAKPDPDWPNEATLESMLAGAFNGNIINSLNHPEIAKLLLK